MLLEIVGKKLSETFRTLNEGDFRDKNTELLLLTSGKSLKIIKGQLQRFHKLISNDRIWSSEHGFEVIFEKSLFVFEISAFKVRN